MAAMEQGEFRQRSESGPWGIPSHYFARTHLSLSGNLGELKHRFLFRNFHNERKSPHD